MTISAVSSSPQPLPAAPTRDAQLHDAAKKLEAGFLSEMLKAAGVGKPLGGLGGGGVGEEQFASFLREAQAAKMVEGGGLGLAQSLYEALKERS